MIELNHIYNEDCLTTFDKIDDSSIDLIVTDPPYGLNFNNGDLACNWERVFGGDVSKVKPRPILNDSEEEANELFRSFLKKARRVLKRGSGCCCCCCCGGGGPKPLFAKWTLWMDEFLEFKQAVVWDKGGLGMGMHYRRNYEFMLVAIRPGAKCVWNGGNNTPNVFRFNKIIPSEKEHPTEKPIELMEHFVRLHSNEGDIVYDPFVGHGATLIASERLGRRWIGSELVKEYCDVAEKRIEHVKKQQMLFRLK